MEGDKLNRVVSDVGVRLQKQKDAIARLENREKLIRTVIEQYRDEYPASGLAVIEDIINGDFDDAQVTT